jgi:hypothetical protein
MNIVIIKKLFQMKITNIHDIFINKQTKTMLENIKK